MTVFMINTRDNKTSKFSKKYVRNSELFRSRLLHAFYNFPEGVQTFVAVWSSILSYSTLSGSFLLCAKSG